MLLGCASRSASVFKIKLSICWILWSRKYIFWYATYTMFGLTYPIFRPEKMHWSLSREVTLETQCIVLWPMSVKGSSVDWRIKSFSTNLVDTCSVCRRCTWCIPVLGARVLYGSCRMPKSKKAVTEDCNFHLYLVSSKPRYRAQILSKIHSFSLALRSLTFHNDSCALFAVPSRYNNIARS